MTHKRMGTADTLYPALQSCGVTERAACGFTCPSSSHSVSMRDIGAAKGFTLIELLVVVLIIGILSAVALPQYKKAVAKSRVVQYETALSSLAKASKACMLAKGDVCDLDSLAVSIPPCKPWPGANSCEYKIDTAGSESGSKGSVFVQFGADTGNILYYVVDKNELWCRGYSVLSCSDLGMHTHKTMGLYARP